MASPHASLHVGSSRGSLLVLLRGAESIAKALVLTTHWAPGCFTVWGLVLLTSCHLQLTAGVVQDAWAHRATDPSVLRRRGRNSSSFLGSFVALAFLVLLAAVALHFAQQAGLLKDLPYNIDGLVQQAQATLEPVLEPFVEKARELLGQ